MEKKAFFYDSPIGEIGIAENGRAVTNLFFGHTVTPAVFRVEETALLKVAGEQLSEYFAGERASFSLPLEPEGTAFERSVWKALQTIPYGQTTTYRGMARLIGKENACRAVGRANGKNPISIFIPCHRVIGSDGHLTGYAGGLDTKRYLLQLEQAYNKTDGHSF